MKFVFIAKHRSIWPVAWLCNAMGVSRSGFHAWLNRSPSARSRSDEAVSQQEGKLPCQRSNLWSTAWLASKI
jgi:putative transposase